MKEDILEQLVDDYLQAKGYFTRHNIKFRPSKNSPGFEPRYDSNHSDIDVLGFNPHLRAEKRVWAVTCKSWQVGFRVDSKIEELEKGKIVSGRDAWKPFRELMQPKWTNAFFDAIYAATGSQKFTYVTAVTRVIGDPRKWEQHERFRHALRGNPLRLLSLEKMLNVVLAALGTTVAASDFGRTVQLLKAAGSLHLPNKIGFTV